MQAACLGRKGRETRRRVIGYVYTRLRYWRFKEVVVCLRGLHDGPAELHMRTGKTGMHGII